MIGAAARRDRPGRDAASLGALVMCALAACAGARAGESRQTDALIFIDCAVGDAVVWIDDRPVGAVSELADGVLLAPGEHRLEIRHDRYHTHYAELTARAAGRSRLVVALAEQFP